MQADESRFHDTVSDRQAQQDLVVHDSELGTEKDGTFFFENAKETGGAKPATLYDRAMRGKGR